MGNTMKYLWIIMTLLMSFHAIADNHHHGQYHDMLGNECSPDLPFLDMGYQPMLCDVSLKIYIAIHKNDLNHENEPPLYVIDKHGNHLLTDKRRIIDADYAFSTDGKQVFVVFTLEDGNMGVISEKGILIPPIYDKINPNPFVHIGHDKFLFYLQKDGKTGYADVQGEIVIPMIYDEFGDFKDGIVSAKKSGKWGVIDDNHRIIMPFQFDFDEISTPQGDIIIINKNNSYGYADITGKVFIPPMYQSAQYFYADKAIVQNTNGKWGVIDKSNQPVIDFIYDHISRGDMTYEGKTTHYVIQQHDKYGLLSPTGNVLLKPIYDEIDDDILLDDFLKVKQNGKYGLFNEIGTQFTPIIYERFSKNYDNRHLIHAYLDDETYDTYRLTLTKLPNHNPAVTNE